MLSVTVTTSNRYVFDIEGKFGPTRFLTFLDADVMRTVKEGPVRNVTVFAEVESELFELFLQLFLFGFPD